MFLLQLKIIPKCVLNRWQVCDSHLKEKIGAKSLFCLPIADGQLRIFNNLEIHPRLLRIYFRVIKLVMYFTENYHLLLSHFLKNDIQRYLITSKSWYLKCKPQVKCNYFSYLFRNQKRIILTSKFSALFLSVSWQML